jgi:hypothetical protein
LILIVVVGTTGFLYGRTFILKSGLKTFGTTLEGM